MRKVVRLRFGDLGFEVLGLGLRGLLVGAGGGHGADAASASRAIHRPRTPEPKSGQGGDEGKRRPKRPGEGRLQPRAKPKMMRGMRMREGRVQRTDVIPIGQKDHEDLAGNIGDIALSSLDVDAKAAVQHKR